MSSRASRRPNVWDPPPLVYFAESLRTGYVKIGYTTQLGTRMRGLKMKYGLIYLLGTTAGGKKREKEIHAAFDRLRIEEEWFAPSPLILEFIAANCEDRSRYLPAAEFPEHWPFYDCGGVRFYTPLHAAMITGERVDLINRLLYEHDIPLAKERAPRMFCDESLQLLKEAIADYRSKHERQSPSYKQRSRGLKIKQFWIHPELDRRIKSEAKARAMAYSDLVHEIFCDRYGRSDLIGPP